jgi:hypothetical protein
MNIELVSEKNGCFSVLSEIRKEKNEFSDSMPDLF